MSKHVQSSRVPTDPETSQDSRVPTTPEASRSSRVPTSPEIPQSLQTPRNSRGQRPQRPQRPQHLQHSQESRKSQHSPNSPRLDTPPHAKNRDRFRKFLPWSLFFTLVSLASLVFFSCLVFSLNIIPLKYLIPIAIFLLLVYILLFIAFFKRRLKTAVRIIAYVFSILISALLLAVSFYLSGASRFLNNLGVGDYDTISYSVLVRKDSSYDDIEDLEDHTVGLIDNDNLDQAETKLREEIDFTPETNYNSMNLAQQLLESSSDSENSTSSSSAPSSLDSLCLEQGYINMLSEEVDNFTDDTKVIYTFEIQVPATHSNNNLNPTEDPFIAYISGIDQYGDIESDRGRSDVNQLAIINPKTHRILLLNTPRDYYVQLAGTTGLKDKLTHAGVYGIDKSIDTLNDLYDININYYFRVNFDSLIDLVDAIGGIDIESDTTFTAHTDPTVHVVTGMNHFNGRQALAYSRERYAYETGDRHRGQNQQQVISAIIDQVTHSTVLLTNYSDILSSLGNTFQTDMPSAYISDFVKMQLDSMPTWTIENFAVDGSGSTQPTYSMGADLPLYVMIPDETTIVEAKDKITSVLSSPQSSQPTE